MRTLTHTVLVVTLTALSMSAAYANTGAKIYEEVCADCHEVDEMAGTSATDLEKSIKDRVAGTVKHKKKLALTDAEAKTVAEFLSKGGK